MSWRAYRAVTIGSLAKGPTEQAVLHCLADHAAGDDGSDAYPSNATICEETKFKERAVRDAIGRLRKNRAIDQTGWLVNGTPVYRVYWRDVDLVVAAWLDAHADQLHHKTQSEQEATIAAQLQLSPRAVRGARRRLAYGHDNPTLGGCLCTPPPPASPAGGRIASPGSTCPHPRHLAPRYPAADAPEPSGNRPSTGESARAREAQQLADELAQRVYRAALKNGYDEVLDDDELHGISQALEEAAAVNGSHEDAVSEVERYLNDHPVADIAPAARIDVLLREALKRHALAASGQPELIG